MRSSPKTPVSSLRSKVGLQHGPGSIGKSCGDLCLCSEFGIADVWFTLASGDLCMSMSSFCAVVHHFL
ncbi:hypothetical protein BofuT4_uP065920.1 [Botrytis cinerea T4]|uniref:Uncharacterized protein n=1 Tax=Botryotinia fuckeliana (strain T4) TaxID=999810 RepID=G2XRR7_BOTF4|nr:hypothetical protein BofuT4_uP065920.1 [Botrytis cinerea T4]